MKCVMCDNKKSLKKEVVTLRYNECGLNNVVLAGVIKHSCPECGEEYFNYGNIEQLHSLIKTALIVKKDLLTGSEIRFLRKQMGFSKEFFAHVLGVEIRTVFRWESNKNITKQVDRSIRMAASLKEPDRDYKFHEQLLDDTKSKKYKLMKIKVTGKQPHLDLV